MEQLKQLFRQWANEECTECFALGGGGSARQYFRMRSAHHACVGTLAPESRENEAFFAFTKHFLAAGLPVPEIYAIGSDGLHYLQQNLGDRSLYGLLYAKRQQGGGFDSEMLALYKQALADLHRLQVAGRTADFSRAYPRPAFDRRAMLWDLNYFKYYFLKLQHIPFDEEWLEDDFNRFIDLLLEADCEYFVYRDFQGRNIMLSDTPEHPLYYIDYQGGRRGAAQYDVASLLYSAKSDLPPAVRQELLRHYADLHGDPSFLPLFYPYAYLRLLQTLGAYGYRGLYERKPYFRESIPLALANLRSLLQEHPLPSSMPELSHCLEQICRLSPIPDASAGLTVTVLSFSYKQGLPEDPSGNGGGHIFDCRALPNPGRYDQYKPYTGRDLPVIEFLQREEAISSFLQHAEAIVDQSVQCYLERRFTHLMVCFGCTGGQHRSVYCAEQLAAHLRHSFPTLTVSLHHREQE